MKYLTLRALLIFLALISGCGDGTITVRVIEMKCKAPKDEGGKCSAELIPEAALTIKINPVTKDAALIVDATKGDWWVGSKMYRACAVVDEDNWECGAPGEELIGFQHGKYRRYATGRFGYEVKGVTGWQYWVVRARMAQFAK